MESKKTDPASNDAEIKEQTKRDGAENEEDSALTSVEQIDDSELPQSIKDRFRNQREPEPE